MVTNQTSFTALHHYAQNNEDAWQLLQRAYEWAEKRNYSEVNRNLIFYRAVCRIAGMYRKDRSLSKSVFPTQLKFEVAQKLREEITEDKRYEQKPFYYWENIPQRFRWVAVDSDGRIYAYVHRPTHSTKNGLRQYSSRFEFTLLPHTYLKRSVNAEDSLQERPKKYEQENKNA